MARLCAELAHGARARSAVQRVGLTLALVVVVGGAVGGGAGCACTYPFTIETRGRLEMPLGIVRDCSGTDNIDYMGSTTIVTYELEGLICHLHADWSGPVIDMARLREDAKEELDDLGIDPDEVELRVGKIDPRVDEAGLANRRTNVAVEMPAGALVYRGALSVPGDENVIVVELPEGAAVNDPEVHIRESERLIELANEAWQAQEKVYGTGVADVTIDLARIFEVPDLPRRPAFAVQFDITLEGDAAL